MRGEKGDIGNPGLNGTDGRAGVPGMMVDIVSTHVRII